LNFNNNLISIAKKTNPAMENIESNQSNPNKYSILRFIEPSELESFNKFCYNPTRNCSREQVELIEKINEKGFTVRIEAGDQLFYPKIYSGFTPCTKCNEGIQTGQLELKIGVKATFYIIHGEQRDINGRICVGKESKNLQTRYTTSKIDFTPNFEAECSSHIHFFFGVPGNRFLIKCKFRK